MTENPFRKLVEAALDQPGPSPELAAALNEVLTVSQHPDRDLSRDPWPSRL